MNESPDRMSVRGFFSQKNHLSDRWFSLTRKAESDWMSARSTATDSRTHVQRTELQQCCDDVGGDRQCQDAEKR